MKNIFYSGQENSSQAQPDAESDTDRAKQMLFNLVLGVVNQIFRRTATRFDGPLRHFDPVCECFGDDFVRLLNRPPS